MNIGIENKLKNLLEPNEALDIVVDMDDVLVDSSFVALYLLMESKIYPEILDALPSKEVLCMNDFIDILHIANDRDAYYFTNSYSSSKGNIEIPEHIMDDICSVFSNEALYKFGRTTLLTKTLMNMLDNNPSSINSLSIVSRCLSDENITHKKIWLAERFGKHTDKVTFYGVSKHDKKSEVIKAEVPHYNIFIDDEVKNIEDVILNVPGVRKTFMLPSKKYNDINKFSKEALELLDPLGSSIAYYKEDIHPSHFEYMWQKKILV